MPKSISFDIPGKPGAKQRHRTTTVNGHTRMYTPKETVSYEDFIKWIYMEVKGRLWFTGPLMISVVSYHKIPKNTSAVKTQKMLAGTIKHDKKPDIDNILKIVMDGLTGAAYPDDKLVVECYRLRKEYTTGNERVEVTLQSFNSQDVKEIK